MCELERLDFGLFDKYTRLLVRRKVFIIFLEEIQRGKHVLESLTNGTKIFSECEEVFLRLWHLNH